MHSQPLLSEIMSEREGKPRSNLKSQNAVANLIGRESQGRTNGLEEALCPGAWVGLQGGGAYADG